MNGNVLNKINVEKVIIVYIFLLHPFIYRGIIQLNSYIMFQPKDLNQLLSEVEITG